MESKHVPLLSCSSHICSLRVPSGRSQWTRVYAVGTQRIQRRHRNVGPFQGLSPENIWLESRCWSRRNGQKGGGASRESRGKGVWLFGEVLTTGVVGRKEALLTREGLQAQGRMSGGLGWGGTHLVILVTLWAGPTTQPEHRASRGKLSRENYLQGSFLPSLQN